MSKTVLVVDDEMLIALDIQSQLEEHGHTVLTAATIATALQAIEAEAIDMAILDWHVGSGDAGPLARALAARQIPFIICSGSMAEEVAELFVDVPYIPKPFSPQQLVEAIEGVRPRQPARIN